MSAGPYILITRPEGSAHDFAEAVKSAGFTPLLCPVMTVKPLEFAIPERADYEGLVFTSANAVRIFAQKAGASSLPVYTVGDDTAREARLAGFNAVMSAGGTGAELAAFIKKNVQPGTRLLHIRGADTAFPVQDALQEAGLPCESLIIYKTQAVAELNAETLAAFQAGRIYAVTLFSVRTAEAFFTLLQRHGLVENLDTIKTLCLGDSVLKCVQAYMPGLAPDAYAAQSPDRRGMMDLIRRVCTV